MTRLASTWRASHKVIGIRPRAPVFGSPSIHTPNHGACLPLKCTEVYRARFSGLRQANTRCSEQLWLSWTAAILQRAEPSYDAQDRLLRDDHHAHGDLLRFAVEVVLDTAWTGDPSSGSYTTQWS